MYDYLEFNIQVTPQVQSFSFVSLSTTILTTDDVYIAFTKLTYDFNIKDYIEGDFDKEIFLPAGATITFFIPIKTIKVRGYKEGGKVYAYGER